MVVVGWVSTALLPTPGCGCYCTKEQKRKLKNGSFLYFLFHITKFFKEKPLLSKEKNISLFMRLANHISLERGLIRWRLLFNIFFVRLLIPPVRSLLFCWCSSSSKFSSLFRCSVKDVLASSEQTESNPSFLSIKIGLMILNHSESSVKANC